MRYKVNASDLKTGMYVAELDRPWVGTPFMFQGFLIESNEELEQLKAVCAFVFVDATQSSVDVAAVGKPADGNNPVSVKSTSEPGKPSNHAMQHPAGMRATVEHNVSQLLAKALRTPISGFLDGTGGKKHSPTHGREAVFPERN